MQNSEQPNSKDHKFVSPVYMTHIFYLVLFVLTACLSPTHTHAFTSDRVVAVVNGAAVTSSDVTTHRKILSLGGRKISEKAARTAAIETLLKIQEAENRKVTPSEEELEEQIKRISSSQKKTPEAFLKTLSKKGIIVPTYKKYLKAQIGWRRILGRDYGKRIKIDEAAVQEKYEKLKKNPKRGITLAILQPIQLPLGKGANQQVVRARAADAQKLASRFKSCGKIRAITEDIYNVRILKRREVHLKGLNPKARKVLRQKGAGSIVSVNINPKAGVIDMMAYCGNRSLKAKIPSFEQYKNAAFMGEMNQFSVRHMKKVKELAIIEIKGK